MTTNAQTATTNLTTATKRATELDRLATDTRACLLKEINGEPGQHHSHVYEYVDHLRAECRIHISQANYDDLPFHLRKEKDPTRYRAEVVNGPMILIPGQR